MSDENNEKDKKTRLQEQLKKFKTIDLSFEGEKLVLPKGMDLDTAIVWLERKRDEMEESVSVWEEIDCYPMDGALALTKALAMKFGWSRMVPTPGFFGPRPPAMIGVEVAPGETVQVPWGRMRIPNMAGYIETEISAKEGKMPIFAIGGEVKQKHRHIVAEIAALTRDVARVSSIYRGKAIRVQFPGKDEKFDPSKAPKFLDVTKVNEEELIFSDEVRRLVNTSLFVPIEKTELCRQYQIPLKRGVLLEGPYGTGKTLTAYVTAKKAEANGWTFIYLTTVDDLAQAILFAKQYSPAVIFAEDIDSVVKTDRTDKVNEILNTIDGVESKHSEIIVCLTTNHVERISQAMLRPGRLDAVISVRPPDAAAVDKLIRLYGRDLIGPEEDLRKVGVLLDGKIPALIREVVERAKLSAVGRLNAGERMHLKAIDLETAAQGMLHHLELLKPKEADTRSDREKAADRVARAIETTKALNGHGNGHTETAVSAGVATGTVGA